MIANGYGDPKNAMRRGGKRIESVGDSVGHKIGIDADVCVCCVISFGGTRWAISVGEIAIAQLRWGVSAIVNLIK